MALSVPATQSLSALPFTSCSFHSGPIVTGWVNSELYGAASGPVFAAEPARWIDYDGSAVELAF